MVDCEVRGLEGVEVEGVLVVLNGTSRCGSFYLACQLVEVSNDLGQTRGPSNNGLSSRINRPLASHFARGEEASRPAS